VDPPFLNAPEAVKFGQRNINLQGSMSNKLKALSSGSFQPIASSPPEQNKEK
jgi:hypothetical protein